MPWLLSRRAKVAGKEVDIHGKSLVWYKRKPLEHDYVEHEIAYALEQPFHVSYGRSIGRVAVQETGLVHPTNRPRKI